MPKVKPLIRPDPRQVEMRRKIAGILAVSDMNIADAARATGIKYSTLSAHLHDIGNLRLKELWAIEDLERGKT